MVRPHNEYQLTAHIEVVLIQDTVLKAKYMTLYTKWKNENTVEIVLLLDVTPTR